MADINMAQARKAAGATQQDVALLIGAHKQTIYSWEKDNDMQRQDVAQAYTALQHLGVARAAHIGIDAYPAPVSYAGIHPGDLIICDDAKPTAGSLAAIWYGDTVAPDIIYGIFDADAGIVIAPDGSIAMMSSIARMRHICAHIHTPQLFSGSTDLLQSGGATVRWPNIVEHRGGEGEREKKGESEG